MYWIPLPGSASRGQLIPGMRAIFASRRPYVPSTVVLPTPLLFQRHLTTHQQTQSADCGSRIADFLSGVARCGPGLADFSSGRPAAALIYRLLKRATR